MIHSSNGDGNFFDIVVEVLQGNTLAPYSFILCIGLVQENGFTFKKARSRRYPTKNMADADYADDLVLLANTPAQTESLLHSQEQAAGSNDVCTSTNRIEFIWIKQEEPISILSGKPLKLVDLFIYVSSNISSAESDVNICLEKALNAIERLLIIWKFYLSDKIKQVFFQDVAVSTLIYRCTS